MSGNSGSSNSLNTNAAGLTTTQATPGWTKLYNRPAKEAILYHIARPTEKSPGCQAIIVRKGCPLPSYLHCHKGFADHLRAAGQQHSPEGPSAIVFIQNAPACLAFTSYDQANEKLAITGSNYAKLLDFFDNDYERVCSKMKLDMGSMATGKDLVRINHQLYFVGSGTSNYQTTLNPHDKEHLVLHAVGNSDTGHIDMSVAYADDSLGSLHLNTRAFSILAKSRAEVRELIDPPVMHHSLDLLEQAVQAAVAGYKEGPISKRSRQ